MTQLRVCVALLGGIALAAADGSALAASKRIDTVGMPSCTGGLCQMPNAGPTPAFARGKRTVWLDFEGGTLQATAGVDDALTDRSFILSLGHSNGSQVTIPPFDPADLSGPQLLSRAQIIAEVVAEMVDIHAAYDIEFVTSRPLVGPYQRLIIGGTCESVSGHSNCAGIAVLDCADGNRSNIGYAHPDGLTIEQLITTAAQEMAHAFGLNHTTDETDIMFPSLQFGTNPRRYGSGPIPMGESACGGAVAQDSHDMLLSIVGPSGQDVREPTIAVTAPGDGALDSDGDLMIAVTASDDIALASVGCAVDGVNQGTATEAPFEFAVTGLGNGSHDLTCSAVDASGNIGSASLEFFVGECLEAADCGDGFSCSANMCVEGGDEGMDPACDGDPACADDAATPLSCVQASVSGGSAPGPGLLVLVAAVALGLRRRGA